MAVQNIFKPNTNVYFVGIKGTGVCALAELMFNAGLKCSGSDIPEVFYTDAILNELGIPYYNGYDAAHINSEIDVLIYSSAYSTDTNPELERARELNIPMVKYADALGEWSARFDSTGVCGVHGKTTTTAICGIITRAANIPAQILVGSAAFEGRSTLCLGDKYFIAETCEYREHFLSFRPRRIILTSVEWDHQDYFKTYESIRDAFVNYCRLLPEGGQLIYCADDPGANEVVDIIAKEKRKIDLVPYGFTASGDYKITSYNAQDKKAVFFVAGIPGQFKLSIPGRHEALNATAALALVVSLNGNALNEKQIQSIKNDLEGFKCAKRRSEIIGEAKGIIFMDDYGHHPTAIKTTLEGIKSFYPKRRIIVSFMSHTYSRTSKLLKGFSECFNDADILFLHKIYASAREDYDVPVEQGGINGKTLYEKAASVRGRETYYIEEIDDAFQPISELLKPGDIFLTMGAGNNWPLGEKLFAYFNGANHD
jgi:UDP-N-acetylmuramate--alanine ligase